MCPKCSIRSRTKSPSEFKKQCYEILSTDYQLLSDYKTSKTKVAVKHTICHKTYYALPSDILQNKTHCPTCSHNKKRTHEEFLLECRRKNLLTEFDVLGKYETSETPIALRHNLCGKEFTVRPYLLLNGADCPFCRNKSARKTFNIRIKETTNSEYKLIDEYKNYRTKVSLLHKRCTKIIKITPSDFFSGVRCAYCRGVAHKTPFEFREEMKSFPEYEVLQDYINATTKIKFKHLTCNNTFYKTPSRFLNWSSCPFCVNRSNGEKIISNWLRDHGIEYIPQKTFHNLKTEKGYLLFLDFYIPEYNLAIEYDGQQHFKDVPRFKSNLKENQIRDSIKNNFCKTNKITLVRIPYYEVFAYSLKKFQHNLTQYLETELTSIII